MLCGALARALQRGGMSLPLASRPASPGFCVCLFACLLPGLLLPGVLLAQTGVAAPSTIGRLDVAGDWLRASGLDGFPSAFSDMLRMSLPDDCNASAVADAPAFAFALQQTLANAIPPELPAAVAPWLDSETAVRVREAESSLAGLDDAAYARLRDEHQAELTGGSTRLGQIRTLVDKTRAARLNTVMFNELELRERLFAQCRDPEALQALWSEIGEVSSR